MNALFQIQSEYFSNYHICFAQLPDNSQPDIAHKDCSSGLLHDSAHFLIGWSCRDSHSRGSMVVGLGMLDTFLITEVY